MKNEEFLCVYIILTKLPLNNKLYTMNNKLKCVPLALAESTSVLK